jgi:hypothetical protein
MKIADVLRIGGILTAVIDPVHPDLALYREELSRAAIMAPQS